MAGITNRPEEREERNQQRLEERKREVREGGPPEPSTDQEIPPEDRGRISETGAGRGLGKGPTGH